MYRFLFVVLFIFTVNLSLLYGHSNHPQLHHRKSHRHRFDDVQFVPHRLRQSNMPQWGTHSMVKRMRRSALINNERPDVYDPYQFLKRAHYAGENKKPPANIKKHQNEYNIITRLPQPVKTKVILSPLANDQIDFIKELRKKNIRKTTEEYEKNMKELQEIIERNQNNLIAFDMKAKQYNDHKEQKAHPKVIKPSNPENEDRVVDIIEQPQHSPVEQENPEFEIQKMLPGSELTIMKPELDQYSDIAEEIEVQRQSDSPQIRNDHPQSVDPVSYFRLEFKKDKDDPYIQVSTNLPIRQVDYTSPQEMRLGRFKIHQLPVYNENEDESGKMACYKADKTACYQVNNYGEKTTSVDSEDPGDPHGYSRKAGRQAAYLNPGPHKRFFHFGRGKGKSYKHASDKVMDKQYTDNVPKLKSNAHQNLLNGNINSEKTTTMYPRLSGIGLQGITPSKAVLTSPLNPLASPTTQSPEQSKASLFKEIENVNQLLRDSIHQMRNFNSMTSTFGNPHKPGHIVTKMVTPVISKSTYPMNSINFWDDEVEQRVPTKQPKPNMGDARQWNVIDSDIRNKMTESDVNKPTSKSLLASHGDPILRILAANRSPTTRHNDAKNSRIDFNFDPMYSTRKMNKLIRMFEPGYDDGVTTDRDNWVEAPRSYRSKTTSPVEMAPKFDSIYNLYQPKGSYDLQNVSKITFHAIKPHRVADRQPTTNAFLYDVEGEPGGHSKRKNFLNLKLYQLSTSMLHVDQDTEVKRSTDENPNEETENRMMVNMASNSNGIQNQIVVDTPSGSWNNMERSASNPSPIKSSMVSGYRISTVPAIFATVEQNPDEDETITTECPIAENEDAMSEMSVPYILETGTGCCTEIPEVCPSECPIEAPPECPSKEPPECPSIIPPLPHIPCPSQEPTECPSIIPPIQHIEYNIECTTECPTKCTTQNTCAPETTTVPISCATPDEPDYDADEIKPSPCPPNNDCLQQQRIIHLQDQLSRYEAKDKFYEVERLQMEADAIESQIPIKEMMIQLMEDMDMILKRIIAVEQASCKENTLHNCTRENLNLLMEAISESQCTIKRIESTLEKIAENASDLKEETDIGLEEARLRMTGISNRLEKEKRRIDTAREEKLAMVEQRKMMTKRKNKKFRLFRWKRLLQDAIDLLGNP